MAGQAKLHHTSSHYVSCVLRSYIRCLHPTLRPLHTHHIHTHYHTTPPQTLAAVTSSSNRIFSAATSSRRESEWAVVLKTTGTTSWLAALAPFGATRIASSADGAAGRPTAAAPTARARPTMEDAPSEEGNRPTAATAKTARRSAAPAAIGTREEEVEEGVEEEEVEEEEAAEAEAGGLVLATFFAI